MSTIFLKTYFQKQLKDDTDFQFLFYFTYYFFEEMSLIDCASNQFLYYL